MEESSGEVFSPSSKRKLSMRDNDAIIDQVKRRKQKATRDFAGYSSPNDQSTSSSSFEEDYEGGPVSQP